MLRALALAMTVLVLPWEYAQADAPPNLDANAALKYWQAFATLPRFTAAEQKKLHAECLTMPLNAQARKFVSRAAYSLRMLHRGAALPRCDWGIGWAEEGIDVRLPHNDGARVLTSLACLRARLRFEEGKSADAIEDLVAALTLARHISREGVYVMLLAGYAIEHRASETLARYLPRLDAKPLRALQKRLEVLPPGGTAVTGLKLEEQFALDWFVRQVKEAKDRESLLALLGRAYDSPEKGRAFLKECGGTARGVLACAEQTRQSYALMAKKLALPPEQFWEEEEREVRKRVGNPVFRMLFPAIQKVRLLQARHDIRRALLAAALAVQLDGKDALKKHRDPVGGGPFAYVAFKGGFELRSTWKLDEKLRAKWKMDEQYGKPVTLTVGRREK
jgi:hypothetical protein